MLHIAEIPQLLIITISSSIRYKLSIIYQEVVYEKRFSLRYKLILIFGLLIWAASAVEIALGIFMARRAVIEKLKHI